MFGRKNSRRISPMNNFHKLPLLATGAIWFTTPLSFAVDVGKQPPELVRLIELRMSALMRAVKPIDDKFFQELESLKTKFTKAGDFDSGIAVNNELKKFQETRLLEPKRSEAKPILADLKVGDFDGEWTGVNPQVNARLKIKGLEIIDDSGAIKGIIKITSPSERTIELRIEKWIDNLHVSSATDMMAGKNSDGGNTWWRKTK